MATSTNHLETFLASAETLSSSAWDEIVRRCKAQSRALREANEPVSAQLASDSVAGAKKKETDQARAERRAAVWRINDRLGAIAAAAAAEGPKSLSEARRKAIVGQLALARITLELAPKLKKSPQGKAAIETVLAPFDGFIKLGS
jgi:hypothetical protein